MALDGDEHWWGHIEHLLLQCPCVHPADQPDASCADLPRADLTRAEGVVNVGGYAVCIPAEFR